MLRSQHLEFCRQCTNRKFDPSQGVICGLTNRQADFENTCESFQRDESVKMETLQEAASPGYQVVSELSGSVASQLRSQQDIVYAVVGGAAAAIVGALLWAVVTVTTQYQIGYMALGVGLLVGFSVRYYGAGIDKYFGYVGAFFALLGCALGNLFSQIGFFAEAESLGYFESITLVSPETLFAIFIESFQPMDVLFYAIAAYEGYKFAFRTVSDDVLKSIAAGRLEPVPYAALRMPSVIVLFVLLSVGIFFVSKGSVGPKTFYYESGAKRSAGELIHGKENGKWEYWWENGNLQYQGFFMDGRQDSIWQFYDENGKLYRKTFFKDNLQHGLASDYYPAGQPSNSGMYLSGRLHGLWTYFYENGNISQKGFYHLDTPDSTWEVYHDNGKPLSQGSYQKGVAIGKWTFWDIQGTKIREIEYTVDGIVKIINSWNKKGMTEVVNGNGVYRRVYDDGNAREVGMVKDGFKTGSWKRYFINGKVREEVEFKMGKEYVVNAWSPEGKPTVTKGEGEYEALEEEDTTIVLSGLIRKGLRSGKWTTSSASTGTVINESTFQDGKLEGPLVTYFEDGKISIEGNYKNDKRDGQWKWYFQNGEIETSATFIGGEKEGEQSFFDENGVLLRTEVYSNGELIDTIVG